MDHNPGSFHDIKYTVIPEIGDKFPAIPTTHLNTGKGKLS